MELTDAIDRARSTTQGVLVTLKADGRPQLSNIIYTITDDGVIRISVTDDRSKTINARRDSRVSLYVTRDDFYAYLVIEGTADLTPVATSPDDATADELVSTYRAMAGEHPDWDEYRRTMVADRRLVLKIQPERAYGMWT